MLPPAQGCVRERVSKDESAELSFFEQQVVALGDAIDLAREHHRLAVILISLVNGRGEERLARACLQIQHLADSRTVSLRPVNEEDVWLYVQHIVPILPLLTAIYRILATPEEVAFREVLNDRFVGREAEVKALAYEGRIRGLYSLRHLAHLFGSRSGGAWSARSQQYQPHNSQCKTIHYECKLIERWYSPDRLAAGEEAGKEATWLFVLLVQTEALPLTIELLARLYAVVDRTPVR